MKPDCSDSAYEKLLRRGLEFSRQNKGNDHEDTITHLAALSVHLIKMGKTVEAKNLADERDSLLPLMEQRRAQMIEKRTEAEVQSNPLSVHATALKLYKKGHYPEARKLLNLLLNAKFELPGTHCHLARIALMTDQLTDAVSHTDMAWQCRAEATSYVTARSLWLKICLAILNQDGLPASNTSIQADNLSNLLGRLKTALQAEGSRLEWSMQPVLDNIKPKLSPEAHELLSSLIAVLSAEADISSLDQYTIWREAKAESLE